MRNEKFGCYKVCLGVQPVCILLLGSSLKFLKQSLFAASAVTITANLLGKFLGYFREAVNANYFGTSAEMDTFILAFTVPEIISTIAFLSIPSALIMLLKKNEVTGEYDEPVVFWSGFYLFFFIFLSLSIAVYLLRAQILDTFFSIPSSNTLAMRIISISAGCILFRGLEAYFRSWLFAKKHFIIPAISNITLNIIVLLFVFSFYRQINIESLAYGWLAASSLVFIINGLFILWVLKPGFVIMISNKWVYVLVKSIFAVFLVEIIASLYPVVDRYLIARYLGVGENAGLRYAMIIYALPIGIIAQSYIVASFPWISEMVSQVDFKKIENFLERSLNMLLYLMGYISIFIIIYSEEIVSIAFRRGEFGFESTKLTSLPLKFYAIGLVFTSIYIFLMRFYYAKGKMLKLASIFFFMLTLKAVLSYLLINHLGNGGLALATSISMIFGSLIISKTLYKELSVSIFQVLFKSIWKILLGLIIMTLLLISAKYYLFLPDKATYIYITINIGAVIIISGAVYIALGLMLKIDGARYIAEKIGRIIFWKK